MAVGSTLSSMGAALLGSFAASDSGLEVGDGLAKGLGFDFQGLGIRMNGTWRKIRTEARDERSNERAMRRAIKREDDAGTQR